MTQYGGQEPTTTGRRGRHEPSVTPTAVGAETTARMAGTQQVVRPTGAHAGLDHAKTSAAAVFALVFGLAALFCALTAILAPAAVLFGIIGVVLAVVGLKMAKRPGVTARGVAIGGLVTALLGLLLGGAVIAGLSALVNDERRLDQLQTEIDQLRNQAPSTDQLRSELPS